MSDQPFKKSGFGIGEAGNVPASTPEDDLEAAHIVKRREPDYPAGRRLACGHTVYYRIDVMSASRGSSCQYCYDRMSD